MSAMTLQGSEHGRPLCRARMGHFSASDILRCLHVYRGRRGVERKDGEGGKEKKKGKKTIKMSRRDHFESVLYASHVDLFSGTVALDLGTFS